MNVVLLSTYELGRQPFGLASPAAWLREAGVTVTCLDLSRSAFEEELIRSADLVGFYVPMHTATRIATLLAGRVSKLNPRAHMCFFGLYAPVNESFLRKLGAETILGGEFEAGLLSLVERLQTTNHRPAGLPQHEPVISTARQRFRVPDRRGLPALRNYAKLDWGNGEQRLVGYTEASRGCKHLCRHCPVVPVYQGRFRVVQREVVLEDIRRQVAAGASHITFGDPDFFNGVGHSIALVEEFHREHPRLTYDATIKIEHLLQHARHLRTLRDTGCLFVTSAVEAVDDRVLHLLDKGHTRADFVQVVKLVRNAGLHLSPTFVTFTPWTSLEGYLDMLSLMAELDMAESISPIQLAIRLLIPAGSKLLELAEVREQVGEFDEGKLSYPWMHCDARVEQLFQDVRETVGRTEALGQTRSEIFPQVWELAERAPGKKGGATFKMSPLPARATLPYINEPWFC